MPCLWLQRIPQKVAGTGLALRKDMGIGDQLEIGRVQEDKGRATAGFLKTATPTDSPLLGKIITATP